MVRRRGNRWQADVKIDGERVRKSFRTREAAEEFERLSLLGVASASPETLKAFASKHFMDIWGANTNHKFTRVQLNSLYRHFGEDALLVSLDTDKVDDAISEWRDSGLAPVTINHRLGTLSKLLKYALRKRVIATMPTIERQKVSNLHELVWDQDTERDAELFFRHIGLEAEWWICQFLLYTGARIGEAYLLKRTSVRDGWATFWRKTTKGKATRSIPLVPKAKEAWDALCRMSNLENPLEIVAQRTFRQHWNLFRSHRGQENNREFVPHMLRHTCATRLVQKGVALPQVMKWMGHKSIQVTMRYVYVAPRDLDFAAQALSCSGDLGMVPPVGVEPTRLSSPHFECGASTNSATGALSLL